MDKMFLMLPEFEYKYDKLRAKKDYEAITKDAEVNKLLDSIFKANGVDVDIEETPKDYQKWWKANKENYLIKNKEGKPLIGKIRYNHKNPTQKNSRAQRNNLLIDISRSILTNHDTVDKFISPGSFDKLKRIARISEILDDEEMLDKAMSILKKNKQLFIGEGELNTSFDLFSLSDDDLKAITSSKEKDPLSPLTFMYYHKQNMTGGALIGMYANNTTGFAKFQSKDQSRSRMSLKCEVVINGHTYKALDKIQSPNGDIVSKNCAEFSAASVDNVKDPVLAKLMQSTDTANITALMLRLGMSIEEIGLLFTQPIIKKWINAGMPSESKLDYIATEYMSDTEVENAYSRMSSAVSSLVLQYDIPMMDLVFGKILNQERYQNQLYNKNQTLLTQYNISQLRILLLMSTLHDISEQLHRVTKVSRADSPNGAVAITIAGNIIQRQEVDALKTAMKAEDWMINGTDIYLDESKINANMDIDELRNAIMSSDYPMLQAFYSLGIDFTKDLMKDGYNNYFKYYEVPLMSAVKELTLASTYDTLNEKQLNNFFRNYVKYALSNLDLFKGNTGDFNQTRDFYLSEYPNRFMRLKNDYPELTEIGIIKRIIQNDKTGNLQLKDSGRITPSMRESFMRDFEYIQFKGKEDPMYARLAMDLFAYAYFKDGLYFGPNNFGQFFSPTFLNNIPNFINALRNLEVSDADNYLKQYLLNHLDEGILRELPKDDAIKRIYKPPYQDEYSKEMFVLMNTEFILNYKDLVRGNKGKWKPKVRRYFKYEGGVYIGQEEDGQPKYENGTFLCEYISGGPKYCTYKLIRAIDHSVKVKQSNGSYKQGSVGDRYDKSMNYQELSKYRVTEEMELFYSDVSEETPINYLNDLIIDPEIKPSEPTINTEVYTAETNENKENNCKR